MAPSPRAREDASGARARSILLASGILSSLLYVAVDAFAAWQWDAYSYAGQTVSELSAIGAPTRSLWLAFGAVYGPLLIAFACGVWLCARGRRALRVTAVLVASIAVVGFVWGFFPMHLRGAPTTMTDTMHLVLAGINGAITLTAIAFAASALGAPFRGYSIATIVALLAAGAGTSLYASDVAAGLPTPWIGLLERVSVHGYLLWVLVLAVALLRERPEAARERESSP